MHTVSLNSTLAIKILSCRLPRKSKIPIEGTLRLPSAMYFPSLEINQPVTLHFVPDICHHSSSDGIGILLKPSVKVMILISSKTNKQPCRYYSFPGIDIDKDDVRNPSYCWWKRRDEFANGSQVDHYSASWHNKTSSLPSSSSSSSSSPSLISTSWVCII